MTLIIIGFLTLFLELACIRWMPANMFALAYFSNTVLLAVFLGLGLGFLMGDKKRDLFAWFLSILTIVVGISYLFRFVFVAMGPPAGDILWNFYYVDNWMRILSVHMRMLPALVVAFVLSAAPFVILGQKTAILMREKKPLVAYGLNTLGGLLGIIAFTVLSFAGKNFGRPVVWFGIVGVFSMLIIGVRRWRMIAVSVGITILLVVGLFFGSKSDNWSPYYDISVLHKSDESPTHIFVNRFFHQAIVNFKVNELGRQKYDLAYTLKKPQSVMVLGAGSGNDVATALRNGATKVDAVEIDPLIASVGTQLHPSQPYQDPRVHLHITDARSFLRRATDQYDMIVFGTLDSHALLSGLSNVRVENFVYTVESLRDASHRLSADGIVVIMYSAPQQWLADKIVKAASDVFPADELLLHTSGDHFLYNTMVIGGPGVRTIRAHGALPSDFQVVDVDQYRKVVPPTDNWPYLYLANHGIPSHYLWAAFLLFMVASVSIGLFIGKRGLREGWSVLGLEFFMLGAAFILLETKSVTTLALLYGSTWVVNAAVFASITLLICVGTWVMHRYELRRIWVLYAILGGLLFVNFIVPSSAFLGLPAWARFTLPALMATSPLLIASLIFSARIKHATSLPWIMGINLLGVMFGGLLDYISMATGQRFLYVVAGLLYAVAYFAGRRAVVKPEPSDILA